MSDLNSLERTFFSVPFSYREKREAIRRRGDQVLVWNYKEKLEDFVDKRPDVFKKVK